MSNRSPFDVLTEAWEPRIRAAFLKAISDIADGVNVDLLVDLLKRGDVDGALNAVGVRPSDFAPLEREMYGAYVDGGSAFTGQAPAIRQPDGSLLRINFDARSPTAEQWTKEQSSTLIRQIVDDQRTTIRNHLTAGLEIGDNPRTTALQLVGRREPSTGMRTGGVIGLTSQQEKWQRNYSAEIASANPADLQAALNRELRDKRFDRTILKAIKTGEPIPADIQAKMRMAYRNRFLKLRADTIARTETLLALAEAQRESFRQQIRDGVISQQDITRFWENVGDKRVRKDHIAIPLMNKAGVAWDEPFKSPDGPVMHAPHGVQCRCRERIEVDYFAKFRRARGAA